MLSNRPAVAHRLISTLTLALTLAACGGAAATPTTAPAPTSAPVASAASVDLGGIKTYLVGKTGELKGATAELKALSDRYYDLSKSANFDYATLTQQQPAELAKLVGDARTAWKKASPLYEQMEGIVAGTPSLAQYDVDMDAGAAGAEDPENAVSFDLRLPDGKTLPKPGNLFGVTESALWGTFADFRVNEVALDVDGDGTIGFGDALPDANEDAQIGERLSDLKAFVADVYHKEQSGQRFSAEDADLLGKEAQDRATAITGQISQVAAKLNIKIAE
jgi:hypothetical protein